MKNDFLKFAGITSLLMSVFALAPCGAKAECSDSSKFLCMSYQQKFEKALVEESSEGNPLLIMDFNAFNAWEDLVKETESLRETVSEDFEAYNNYRVTYQAEKMPSYVLLTDDSPDDPGQTVVPKSGINNNPNGPTPEVSNVMQLDESSFADLKLRGIMEDEYRVAASETSSDAIVSDSMEFSYSKVMDNYFRGIKKTDVRKIASHFINKFLKEPCPTANAESKFDMRRLMLYRETLKEAAGLGYYAQVQSLDWAELLDDFEADIEKYSKGEKSDINKIVRINYLTRQFLNKLFAVLVQNRAAQLELISVKRMFSDKVMLRKSTMKYAKELAEEIATNKGEEG